MFDPLETLVSWQQRALGADVKLFVTELLSELSASLGAPFAWLLLENAWGQPHLYAHHGFEPSLALRGALTWPDPMPEPYTVVRRSPLGAAPMPEVPGFVVRLPTVRNSLCGLAGLELHDLNQEAAQEHRVLLRGAVALLAHTLNRAEAHAFAPPSVLMTSASLEPPGPYILYVNRAFTALTGYTLDEVRGRTPRLLQGEGTDRRVLGRMKDELGRTGFASGEMINYRKDGAPFTVSLQIETLRDEAGRPTSFVATQQRRTRTLEATSGRETFRPEREKSAHRKSSAPKHVTDTVVTRGLTQVREGERAQLARSLHDDAVQTLIGISYALAQTHRDLGETSVAAKAPLLDGLEGHRLQVLEVARDLRLLVSQLRPAGIEEFGLVASLHNLLTQFRRSEPGLRLHFDEPSLPELPLELALTLFRVTQEALRNAYAHAEATNVWLELEQQGPELLLRVRDDGRGFMIPQQLDVLLGGNHFGLIRIVEGLKQLGGHVDFASPATGGFQLTATVPLG